MPQRSYIVGSGVDLPVDQYGRPFKSKIDRDRFERREKDPEFSRQCSEVDYIEALEALHKYLQHHRENEYENAIEFVEGLQEKTTVIADSLSQLQFDVLRIAEIQNKGWFEADRRPSRRLGSRFNRRSVRQIARYIGECQPEDEADVDDDEFRYRRIENSSE